MEHAGVTRRYPETPLVGVSGVVYKEGKVLLIRRGSPPGKGEWNLPGGLVEVGESLKEAVAREVEEETRVRVTVGDLVTLGDRIIRDKAGRVEYHYVLIDYLCQVEEGEPTPASDAAEARWIAPEQLLEITLPEPIRRVLKKAEVMTHGFREGGKENGGNDGST